MSEQVTIIMPVYNPGKYLRPCLDSLLAQTMKDFRIIAIDDGSTDNSWDVLQEYAAKDSRVLPQQNPYNIGAARTRNIGIQLAQGEYVVILDADDYFEPDYLESLWEACKDNNLDIAVCDFYLRDEKSGTESMVMPSKRFTERINRPFSWYDLPEYLLQLFNFPPYLKMYRKMFLIEYNLLFQDIPNSNDVYFSDMCFIYAQRIIHISKALIHYRFNTGNQISTKRAKNPECICKAFLKIYDEMVRTGMNKHMQKGFYAQVADYLFYTAKTLPDDMVNIFKLYLRESFQMRIGWQNLNTDMFPTEYAYEQVKFLLGDEVNVSGIYRKFFDEAQKRKLILALWGYGELGKVFAVQAKAYSAALVEIYDRDSSKWGCSLGVDIKSFAKRSDFVNAIIMTNGIFEDDILLELKRAGWQGILLDFSAYSRYGLGIDECIVECV